MKLHSVGKIVLFVLALIGAFLVGQHTSTPVLAQSRIRWEYQIVRGPHLDDKINKFGEDGWEAVNLASNGVLLRREKALSSGKQ